MSEISGSRYNASQRAVTVWLAHNDSGLLPRVTINWFDVTTGHLTAFNGPVMADQRDPDRYNAGKTLGNGLAVATAFGIFRQLLP